MHELRFFFDPGSGTCLWSRNDEARRAFGYPVEHWKLPISENTKRWLDHRVTWYDTALDWQDPGGDSPWDHEESQRFSAAVERGLRLLRYELPPDIFLIIDETRRRDPS
jgi:hypothetical protein